MNFYMLLSTITVSFCAQQPQAAKAKNPFAQDDSRHHLPQCGRQAKFLSKNIPKPSKCVFTFLSLCGKMYAVKIGILQACSSK